jgi:hypothetical protein
MYKHFVGSLLAFSNNFFPKLFENVSFRGFVAVVSFSLGVVLYNFTKEKKNSGRGGEAKKS